MQYQESLRDKLFFIEESLQKQKMHLRDTSKKMNKQYKKMQN